MAKIHQWKKKYSSIVVLICLKATKSKRLYEFINFLLIWASLMIMHIAGMLSYNPINYPQNRLYKNQPIPFRTSLLPTAPKHYFYQFQFSYKLMRRATIITSAYRFSTTQNPFQNFLASSKKDLSLKRNAGRNSLGSEVHVPHARLSREAVQSFFQGKQIRNKNVLINVDSSHLLGMRRAVSLQYMNKNIYKGNSEPIDVLQKHNPSAFVTPNELLLDQRVFALTDPLFIEKARKENKPIQSYMREIGQFYESNLQRGVQRFEEEYLVPPQFLYIIETAHNMENSIYFVGLNQYELRQIVASYLSLVQIKILFMEALKYSAKKGISDIEFHHRSKDVLWKMHYSFLQPINYQLLQKIRQEIKGYTFAHAHNFIAPQNQSINFRGMKDKEPDNTKLQKHAILSILFGDIWTKPYTNNPFPYLAEPFNRLSPEDKRLVAEIYNSFYNKYKAAHNKFRNEIA